MPETETKPSQAEIPESPVLAVVDRAREEIAWVRSAYKFAVSIIAVLIAVGLYFSHKSVQDLKSELRDDGERIQKRLTTESSLLARTLQRDLEEEVVRVRNEVTTRIGEEFKQENISSLVAQEAQTRIDAIADNLIEDQIGKQIKPLETDLTTLIASSSAELQDKVKELDAKLTQSRATEEDLRRLLNEARKTVDNVKQQSDFVLTVLDAQGDDRNAFDKLRRWSNDKTFSLHQQAKAAELTILKSHSTFISDAHMVMNWIEGFDPTTMSISDIRSNWDKVLPVYARAYAEFVWKHENVTKEEKLQFLHDVLGNSRGSMQAADWAAETLAKDAKVKYNPPFDFSAIEEWWTERGKTNDVPEKGTNKAIDSKER